METQKEKIAYIKKFIAELSDVKVLQYNWAMNRLPCVLFYDNSRFTHFQTQIKERISTWTTEKLMDLAEQAKEVEK